MIRRHRIGIVLCSALLAAGCATGKSASKSGFVGYLGDYSKLESIKDEGGEEIRRWVNPKLRRGEYLKLLVEPVVIHPAPQATPQVSGETLFQLRNYFNEALRWEFGKSYLLVNQVGPGVARVRLALTGMTAEAEGLGPHAYIPFATLVAGANTATGERNRPVFLVVEAEVTDSVTQERLGIAVRKSPGKNLLKNDQEQLTLERLRPILDDKAANARLILDRVLK